MSFDPKKHVGDFKGRAYMDVASRLLWINEDADRFEIESELVQFDEARAVVKATVTVLTAEGQRVKRAVAHGLAIKAALPSMLAPRYIEKAETSAVGRALSMLGYGTQYAQEFDDAADEHLADSPRQTTSAPPASGAASAGSRGGAAPQPVSTPRAAGGPATQPPENAPSPAGAQAVPLAASATGTAEEPRALGTSAPAGGALPYPEHPPEGERAAITAFFELTRGGWHMDRAATRKQLDPTGLDSDLSDGEAVKAALRRLDLPPTQKGLMELFTRSGPTVETRQPVLA